MQTPNPAVALVLQHMSFEFTVQVPGCPPPAVPPAGVLRLQSSAPLVTQVPRVKLQTSPDGHCESRVHLPHWFGVCAPQMLPAVPAAQSLFVQQFPGTQLQPVPVQSAAAAQQKSAELAVQAPAAVHVEATQPPVLVLQTVPGPYVGSDWHCVSVVHPPHWFAVVNPQIWLPVQSVSVRQLPGMQVPDALQTKDDPAPLSPYALAQFELSAGLLQGKHAPLTQRPAVTPVVVQAVSLPLHWAASVAGESVPESVGDVESSPESAVHESSVGVERVFRRCRTSLPSVSDESSDGVDESSDGVDESSGTVASPCGAASAPASSGGVVVIDGDDPPQPDSKTPTHPIVMALSIAKDVRDLRL